MDGAFVYYFYLVFFFFFVSFWKGGDQTSTPHIVKSLSRPIRMRVLWMGLYAHVRLDQIVLLAPNATKQAACTLPSVPCLSCNLLAWFGLVWFALHCIALFNLLGLARLG